MKIIFIIASAALLLSSCATSSIPKVDKPSHREPKSNAEQVFLRNKTTINTESKLRDLAGKLKGSSLSKKSDHWVWDLNGGILRGDKQSGDGGQSEDQEPMMRIRIPLVIKDGFVQNNKDAIIFYVPNCGVEKVTWLNIGEDAVATSKGAYNFTLKDCEFINDRKGDKSVQLNEAKGAVVDNCLVYSGRTAMRIGSKDATSVSEIAKARNNHIIGSNTGYHVSRITLDVNEGSEKYEKVQKKFVLSNGAKIK